MAPHSLTTKHKAGTFSGNIYATERLQEMDAQLSTNFPSSVVNAQGLRVECSKNTLIVGNISGLNDVWEKQVYLATESRYFIARLKNDVPFRSTSANHTVCVQFTDNKEDDSTAPRLRR